MPGFERRFKWVWADDPRAARKLREAVESAARLIGSRPKAGNVRINLAPALYRFWSLPRFSLLLVYNADMRPPVILRVLHTSRDLPRLLADLDR
jgi:toxin ParE1/3/4